MMSDLSMSESEARTLAEALMRRIRADIVQGELRPGDRLGMRALQDRYSAGISPLREALSRLAALSLVTAEGQRGFRVAQVSEDDLLDLVKTMVWAECTALRAAIARGDREWEAGIIAAAHRLDIDERAAPRQDYDEEWERHHRAFHRALVAACDAPRLLGFRELLFEGMERYRRLSMIYGTGDRDADGEHRALLRNVLDRDAEAACRSQRDHLLETTRIVLRARLGSDALVADRMGTLITAIAQGEGAPP